MLHQFMAYPRNKVSFSQIKSDIENGLVQGLTIYKGIAPDIGVFYIDNMKGDILAVRKGLNGVLFTDYDQPLNDYTDILSKILRYYDMQVQTSDGVLYSADDIRKPDEVVNTGISEPVPLDFPYVYKDGVWKRRPRVFPSKVKTGMVR